MSKFMPRLVVALLTCIVLSGAYLVLGVSPAGASPAAPDVVKTFVQPDGTSIELRLWGDEFVHGWETLDGYTVVRNTRTRYWEYALLDRERQLLVPSGVVVGQEKPPAPPGLRPSLAAINQERAVLGLAPLGASRLAAAPPWAGADTDVLFLMVEFTDLPCAFTDTQMENNLFGGSASGPGDLDDYFDEISYGNLELDGRVEGGAAGCYALANNHTHYDQGPGSARSLVQEAITLADPDVDFSVYDNDGDGFVDALGIIYAGGGPHDGCETDDNGDGSTGDSLWPHSNHLSSAVSVDGVQVYNYIIQSEITYGVADLVCDEMQTIGLFAHEFGHALGLPDLYDRDEPAAQKSSGVGFWSAMASQFLSTTNLADTPPHYDPWSKWFEGWITPLDYTGVDINGAVPQAETNAYAIQLLNNPSGPQIGGSGEYFLVENRQQVNFDSQLPGCGVLIWHIDEVQTHNDNQGHTAGSHRLVDLEEADGQDDLDRVRTDPNWNRGDGGDPFPGTSNNRLFDDTTTPHARLYDGTDSEVRVEVLSIGCEETMDVNFGTIPIADCGGPYLTDEGEDVTLDGNDSYDPDGDPLSCDWDLDDDGVFDDVTDNCDPTFDQVGQDGTFNIALKVSDPGGVFDVDECQVTVSNVLPEVDLLSDAPQDEGSPVTVSGTVSDPGWLDPLSASINWNDGSPIEPIGGVLENLRPDATLAFAVSHTYGDNGFYNTQVCASDDDGSTCQTIVLEINNVPPEVDIDSGQVTEIDEGDLVDVLAHFSDPGWLDTYTSLIDWGTGESEPGSLTVTDPGPLLDQGQVTGSHQYGDNGFFPVIVTVTDDDGGSGSDGFDLTVNNVDPTAEIDESDAIMINGVPTFLAHAGDPLDFSGHSEDPGSDDLFLGWDWDDGPPSPDVTTPYLVNPPNADPFPSPSVQPRDVTDTKTHAFADACLYQISFLADDDDGGHAYDNAYVLIVGNADKARSEGYWEHQYSGSGKIDFDQDTLECYLAIVGYVSTVFDDERDASTIEQAHDVLFLKQNKGSVEEQFDRELLTVWLNFANGAIEYDELLEVATAEAVRLDPNATKAEIREQTNILHHIRQKSK